MRTAIFWLSPTQAFLLMGAILMMITVLAVATFVMNRFARGDDEVDLSDIY